MIRASYHNHTNWSDGTASLDEMIEGARQAGVKEFGVSDHFTLAPGNRTYDWALEPESLDAYVTDVQRAMLSEREITVRMGLEVDYFPETMALVSKRLAAYQFDYLIGSVHFVDDFPIDFDARYWKELAQEDRDRIWKVYWERVRAAAETRAFDFIGHLDLPKKFGYYPSVDLTGHALAALDAIAESGAAIEINTSGWDKPAREAYPSPFLLEQAQRRRIPLVINADAHSPAHVARDFERALLMAMDAGYTETLGFERRVRRAVPLSSP